MADQRSSSEQQAIIDAEVRHTTLRMRLAWSLDRLNRSDDLIRDSRHLRVIHAERHQKPSIHR